METFLIILFTYAGAPLIQVDLYTDQEESFFGVQNNILLPDFQHF